MVTITSTLRTKNNDAEYIFTNDTVMAIRSIRNSTNDSFFLAQNIDLFAEPTA